MGFAILIKKDTVHEWRNCKQSNSQILPVKTWNLLSTYTFITTIRTYACKRLNEIISDNYKKNFVERFSSKTKIGKNSWCFNNSLLSKPDFSSATKRLLSSLKTKTAITPQQVIGGNILNLTWNKVAITFSKNANTEENIRISRLQKRLRNFYRK